MANGKAHICQGEVCAAHGSIQILEADRAILEGTPFLGTPMPPTRTWVNGLFTGIVKRNLGGSNF